MDIRYAEYCLADSLFYDVPERVKGDGGRSGYRELVNLPSDWRFSETGRWTMCEPPAGAHEPPEQGWKVHVSAIPEVAEETLGTVAEYCFTRCLAFKFLPSAALLTIANGKYASRDSSGKFIAIYPPEALLEEILLDLEVKLAGGRGPYILSDLRWRDSPLYVRYGAFTPLFVYTDEGFRVPALRRPDGTLVPDRRQPYFVVPEWVQIPEFLASAAAERISPAQPNDFDFDIREVLHFSNGGGVYGATRRADAVELVLKEARPHAGLDHTGRDAVTRLRGELDALRALQGIEGIPRLFDSLTAGDHEFIAMERLSGTSLQRWVAVHYPSDLPASEADDAAYLESVHRIVDQLHAIVSAVHARGWVLNDLHPGNVLVDDDLNVRLLDFELAARIGDPPQRTMGAPGFAAPAAIQGSDADRYALQAIRLFLYVPLPSLTMLCPGKADALIAEARARFGADRVRTAGISAVLTGPAAIEEHSLGTPEPQLTFEPSGPWDTLRAAMVRSIEAAATPERRDRLFPGDIEQFRFGGTALAFGAAGVFEALHAAGCEPPATWIDWLRRRVEDNTAPNLGLYDGLTGVARVLHALGETEFAIQAFDVCLAAAGTVSGIKLFDGMAGIGLAGLAFYRATGDGRYLAAARFMAAEVSSAVDTGRFAVGDRVVPVGRDGRDMRGNAPENYYGGLLYGWSGPAVFLARMYEVSGERRWLDSAVAALLRDLELCVGRTPDDTTLYLRNGGRIMPYLATGTAGVAVACDLLLRHTDDERLTAAFPKLAAACMGRLCVGSGLFNGRAGLLGALHRVRRRVGEPVASHWIDQGIRGLNLYAMWDGHGLVFPGEQNLRLSADLATGSAGVLHVLNLVEGRTAELLPYLDEAEWGAPPPQPARVPSDAVDIDEGRR